MPVSVKRLTPANFEASVSERTYALVRVDRDRRAALHDGVGEYFSAAWPALFTFGLLLRSEQTRPEWLESAFVSAVGRVRGGVQDGYYLFDGGLVIGHHRGEVRAGVSYGDPEELAAQRQRVYELGFGGRRVSPETLEAARAIVVYFDDLVIRRQGSRADTGRRYVHEERERAAPPPSAPALVDPYEVLGVSRQATDAELKAAYREGLKMNHPDKVAHLSAALQKFAEAQTIAIVEAYERIRAERGG